MIYVDTITIPANTPSSSPVKKTIQVQRGFVKGGNVIFPAGCAGLAHAYIVWNGSQLWPSPDSPVSTFSGDNYVFSLEPFDITTPPFSFDIYGYNLDTVYDHTVTVELVLTKEVSEFMMKTSGIKDLTEQIIQLRDQLRQEKGF